MMVSKAGLSDAGLLKALKALARLARKNPGKCGNVVAGQSK